MENLDWQVNKSTLESTKYILENEVDCDVRFDVGEDREIFKAHKFILRIRSPVFERMFNGSFCESETDPVIPDVSPGAFRTVLRYCYYDCLDIEGDVALSVLYAATKYMLPILERAARKTLIQKLDRSTIWEVCKYSAEVGDKELYARCITYLKGNLSETNLLDVIKYAATTGHEELNAYCRKHLQENLSEANILDVIKYADSIGDDDLHANCKSILQKHLQRSNIWDVYTYSLNKKDLEVHQYCRDYFQQDVSSVKKALESEEFRQIQHDILLDVLHINDKVDDAVVGYNLGISISEIELFKACNVWVEAECLRQKIDVTGINKKTVLGDCLSMIRFPTMLPKDLMTVVYPTGILTPTDIANLGQYMHRDPGSECQVDFPLLRRQFAVMPLESYSYSRDMSMSPMYIESGVRVMLTRLWTAVPGRNKITVRDESYQRSWSMVLDTKHGNHFLGDSEYIRPYIDIEPPQVLEAGNRYTVTGECTQPGTKMKKQPGIKYISIPKKCNPYKEVKIKEERSSSNNIWFVTLSLI